MGSRNIVTSGDIRVKGRVLVGNATTIIDDEKGISSTDEQGNEKPINLASGVAFQGVTVKATADELNPLNDIVKGDIVTGSGSGNVNMLNVGNENRVLTVSNDGTPQWSNTLDSVVIGGSLPGDGTFNTIRAINIDIDEGLCIEGGISICNSSGLNFHGYFTPDKSVGFRAPETITHSVSWILPTGPGTAGQFLQTTGSNELTWAASGGGGGATNPAGNNTELQFNNSGVFGASPNLTFDSATNTLSVSNISVDSGISIGNVAVGEILIADDTGFQGVIVSGDADLASTGVLTIANNAITTAKILDTNVTTDKIANNAVTNDKISGPVSVAKGGTNATSFADKSVIVTQDSGTSTLSALPMTTAGELLIGGSTGPAVSTLTAGSNITITNSDGTIEIASSGGTATPAGSNTQLQFNNNGSFGASANLTFNSATLTLTGNMDLQAEGASQSEIKFYGSNGTNYLSLQAHSATSSDVTLTLPDSDGTANQVLKTDGSGNLGWTTPSGGGGNASNTIVETFGTSTANNNLTDLNVTFSSIPSGSLITEVNYLVKSKIYVFLSDQWKPLNSITSIAPTTEVGLDLQGGVSGHLDGLNLSNATGVSGIVNSGNLVKIGTSGEDTGWSTSTFTTGSNGKFSPNLSTLAYKSDTSDYLFGIQGAFGQPTYGFNYVTSASYLNLGGNPLSKGNLNFDSSNDFWSIPSDDTVILNISDQVNFKTNGGGATGFNTSTTYYVSEIGSTSTTVGGNWAYNGIDPGAASTWTTSVSHGLIVGDKINFTTLDTNLTNYSTNTDYYVITADSTTTLQLSVSPNGIVVQEPTSSQSSSTADKVTSEPNKFKLSLTFGSPTNVTGSSDSSSPWEADIIFNRSLLDLSYVSSGGLWTNTVDHNLTIGDEIQFKIIGSGGPASLNTSTNYFVVDIPDTNSSLGNWMYAGGLWYADGDTSLVTGDKISFTSEGDPLTNYSANTDYFIIFNDVGIYELATTKANAESGTPIIDPGEADGWSASETVPSTTQFKISLTSLGTPITGGSNSTGDWKAKQIVSIGGSWKFTASSNKWTTGKTSGLIAGDKIKFIKSETNPSEYTTTQEYYVISPNSSTNELKLSLSPGGSVVTGSSDSTGYWQATLLPVPDIKLSLTYLTM